MGFKVVEIVSGDEFIVEPSWEWETQDGVEHEGNKVVVFGYQTPKPGMENYQFAKEKLKALLLGKEVELYEPKFFKAFGYRKLVCTVYLNEVDIANYFPEFKRSLRGFLDDDTQIL
jgi:hypothetical protein